MLLSRRRGEMTAAVLLFLVSPRRILSFLLFLRLSSFILVCLRLSSPFLVFPLLPSPFFAFPLLPSSFLSFLRSLRLRKQKKVFSKPSVSFSVRSIKRKSWEDREPCCYELRYVKWEQHFPFEKLCHSFLFVRDEAVGIIINVMNFYFILFFSLSPFRAKFVEVN